MTDMWIYFVLLFLVFFLGYYTHWLVYLAKLKKLGQTIQESELVLENLRRDKQMLEVLINLYKSMTAQKEGE